MTYETPHCITFDTNGVPSVQVLQAVAALTEAGRGGLTPLQNVIDPQVLNNFVRTDNERTISFEYEGFHITVHSEGKILLRNPESISTKFTKPSNVLLVAPRRDDNDLCTDLLQPYPVDQENLLNVTIDKSVDEKLAEWGPQKDLTPAAHKIVSLGDFARSAGTDTVTLPGSIEADLIADKQDLKTLRERIDDTLSDWQSNPSMTVLCFETIDALLAATDLDTTYSFFHDLIPRVIDCDTIAHYHLDPLECDDTVMTTLLPLFDSVIYEDGESTGSFLG